MGEFIPFFKIVLGKKSWRGKEFNKFLPSNSSDDLCILFCLYPSSMLPVWKLSTTVYKRIEPRLFICDSSSACSLFMDKSLYMFIYMWTFWSNPQFQWFMIRVHISVSCSTFMYVCVYEDIRVFVYVYIHVQYTIAYTCPRTYYRAYACTYSSICLSSFTCTIVSVRKWNEAKRKQTVFCFALKRGVWRFQEK